MDWLADLSRGFGLAFLSGIVGARWGRLASVSTWLLCLTIALLGIAAALVALYVFDSNAASWIFAGVLSAFFAWAFRPPDQPRPVPPKGSVGPAARAFQPPNRPTA